MDRQLSIAKNNGLLIISEYITDWTSEWEEVGFNVFIASPSNVAVMKSNNSILVSSNGLTYTIPVPLPEKTTLYLQGQSGGYEAQTVMYNEDNLKENDFLSDLFETNTPSEQILAIQTVREISNIIDRVSRIIAS